MQGGIGKQRFCLAFAPSVARLSDEPVDLAEAGERYGHGHPFPWGEPSTVVETISGLTVFGETFFAAPSVPILAPALQLRMGVRDPHVRLG